VLRGYKDTRSIFFITFIAYWVLGLPCGYILALTDLVVDRMGPAGFWMGFIIGLTSAAIMMMMRMRFLQRQPSTSFCNALHVKYAVAAARRLLSLHFAR
jgi:MATE family multidrug resistance protein